MRRVRVALLGAAIAALAANGLSGPVALAGQGPQGKAAKVTYAPIPGGDYTIDPAHSVVGFAIRHYEINWVRGRFKDFKGSIRLDGADVTRSSVEVTAQVASIDTGVAKRDDHLRTADFFEVEKFPEMKFKSTRVERKGPDDYVLHGDLTLKGVTRAVAIPFSLVGAIKDPRGNTRIGITGETTIDRREFGITWGKPLEQGGVDVGNEVMVELALEAVKAAQQPAGR